MKIKELIAKLQKYPEDMEVVRLNIGLFSGPTFYTPMGDVFVDERSDPEKLVIG